MDEFRTQLRRHNLKATRQRLAVHEVMMGLGHASADMVCDQLSQMGTHVTVASVYNILNGLGSAVCEVAAEMGKGIVKRIGIQDQFGESAPYERLLAKNGITVENIVATAEALQ